MKYRVWINGESRAFGDTGGDVLEIEDVYFIDCDRDTERLILDAMLLVVMNPEFTAKHPGTVHDRFALRAPK